jgi:hypothetical protein
MELQQLGYTYSYDPKRDDKGRVYLDSVTIDQWLGVKKSDGTKREESYLVTLCDRVFIIDLKDGTPKLVEYK